MKALLQPLRLTEPLRSVRFDSEPERRRAAEMEERLRERYDQGVQDGEKGLREQLFQQRRELLELQQGVLQSLRQSLPQVRSECESALVDLALEVAQKLVAGLPISREMVEGAICEALAHVEEVHDITVLLHEQDLDLLQRANAPVLLTAAGGAKLHFEASPDVTRGGCLVQTRFGVLDARRETKFELLKKSLQT
jgi:flagellar assembly protein FliH